MMTRAEKLFNIRAQVQRATADIEHGDTYQSCLTLADALGAVLRFLEEEEAAEKLIAEAVHEMVKGEELTALMRKMIALHLDAGDQRTPASEEAKVPDPETRTALDTLRSEPTKIRRR